MKCDDIRLLLDEYLEGTLPADDAARVKEHLKQCPDCREELQFLKKYLKKAESLPGLKAPDDFMEQLRRKIDAPSRGTLVTKLFYPLKIKIPLEAAALVALAVTGLLIFKPFSPEMAEYRASEPAPEIAADEKHGDTGKDGREKRAVAMEEHKALKKDSATAGDKKVATTHTGDMVASGMEESEPAMNKEKASPGGQVEITLYLRQNVIASAEEKADDTFAARDQDRDVESKAAARKGNVYAKKEKSASEGAMQSMPPAAGQATIGSISGLAQSLDGRIIRQTRDGSQVIVEIPRKNYSQFMRELRGNWSVQRQYPAELPERARKASKVQFNINVEK